MPLPAKREQYTFADVLTWDEGEHIEIINGEAFMMATPSSRHQEISGELFRQLANFLEGKQCKVYPAPFGPTGWLEAVSDMFFSHHYSEGQCWDPYFYHCILFS